MKPSIDQNEYEESIAGWRNEGSTKIECIRNLMSTGVPYKDAKQIVHFSVAWADRKASDEKFHEDLERIFTTLEK